MQQVAAILKDRLNAGDSVIAVHGGMLLQEGSSETHSLLALIEHNSSYGLLIFTTSRNPPQAFTDLSINFTVPIDHDFKCNLDSSTDKHKETDIFIKISRKNLQLLVGMRPNKETEHFISKFSSAMDSYEVKLKDCEWLKKYKMDNFDLKLGSMLNINDGSPPNNLKKKNNVINGDSLPIHLKKTNNVTVSEDNLSFSNCTLTSNPRESVIEQKMSEAKVTNEEKFRIFIGTWNVNGQSCMTSLNDWLISDFEAPDIYAIGFQELDLNTEAFLFNDSPKEDEWLQAVTKSLNSKGKYQKISSIRLVGIMLIVFVKSEHVGYVNNIATDTVGTGIMGKLGNKGGVAVRMDFHDTSFCFVNSHLAAHVEEYERRNQDFHSISSRIVFSNFTPPKTINDHHQVYWFGDLNYRVAKMNANAVKDLVSKNQFEIALEADQLKQQRIAGNAFKDFIEGSIHFFPTYKYNPGTNDWDSSEKNRVPAWCDRILWRGKPIKQLAYRSHPDFLISDHKPVSALFESKVKVVDTVKYNNNQVHILNKINKAENEYLPQVAVNSTEIIFNLVKFMEPQVKELSVVNTGQVPVQFEFINKLDDSSSYCKEWLKIEPFTSNIDPGQSFDITLEVLVDKKTAYKMNSGLDKLDDILVLHLNGGKDIFITVKGTYELSCFGCSLETLSYLKVPIKEIQTKKLIELENGNGDLKTEAYEVPKEVWFLVDYLYRHGLQKEHLFEQSGLTSEFIQIRNWLDSGTPDELSGSVHAAAEALLILLDSTSEPLIPYNLHSECFSAVSSYSQCQQIINQLPEHSRNVFIYICRFLQELLNHVCDNNLNAKTLASIFGEIFIRDPPTSHSDKSCHTRTSMSKEKTDFVYHFLINN